LFWLSRWSQKETEIYLSRVDRVLVVRIDEIGDVVMTTAFLRELRRSLPNATITLLVKPLVFNLVEVCPYVDEVLTWDSGQSGCGETLERHCSALRFAYSQLRRRRFDLAILPRWDTDPYQGSFVTYFSAARWRVAYSERVTERKRTVNRGFDRLFTLVFNDDTPKHEVQRNLDILRYLGGTPLRQHLELWPTAEDEDIAKRLLVANGVTSTEMLIAFGPGKADATRRWPLTNFISLGDWLQSQHDARIVIVGGAGDEPLGRAVKEQLGGKPIDTVGHLTLRQTAALLRHCHCFIGNDSGPKHLAAAVGVPVIEINAHPKHGSPLHPHSSRRFGPWGVPHRVLQPETTIPPCSTACTAAQQHCILQVSVNQVKWAFLDLLPKTTSGRKVQHKSTLTKESIDPRQNGFA
jgi:heptosyltransferase-2